MLDFFRPSSKTAYADLGIFILRVFVSLLLIPHGYDKLLSFLDGAADFPDPLQVGARFSHFLAVVGEVVAPILLILGLLTRLASVVEIVHFLVVAFIALMGFDFLHASANAKMVNLATNFGSICLFMLKGKIIWAVAIPMAFCNAFGGWIGAKLAISKGNKFIRIFFLVVVIGTLIRFAYDVFYK